MGNVWDQVWHHLYMQFTSILYWGMMIGGVCICVYIRDKYRLDMVLYILMLLVIGTLVGEVWDCTYGM